MTRSVAITENGRDGRVVYREPAGEQSFYWEFGGGDVVAIVQVGTADAWRTSAPWAVDRRGEILSYVAAEVVRQKAPGCRADIDDRGGCIYLRQGAAASAPAVAATPASSTRATAVPRQFSMDKWRALRTRAAIGGLVVAVALGGLVWLKDTLLTIDPGKGTPLGASVRTDAHVATLIQTLQPYVPSLHRDHSKDRYRLSIFVVPLDGAAPYLVPVVDDLAPSTYSLAKVLGSDGRTLWFDATGLHGIDLASRKLVSAAGLRKANPSLDPAWWDDTRGMEVEGKLRIVSRDRTQALEIDPSTLEAKSIPPPRSTRLPFAPTLANYLVAGFCTSPDTWLGLHSTAELDTAFAPKRWIRCVERGEDRKAMRRFYRGDVERASDDKNVRIVSITAQGDAEYFNAAFLRHDEKSAPIRFANPDGALIAYNAGPDPKASLVLARADDKGAIAWKVDTGIERFNLRQLLPGEKSVAFVGTRPPVPDKVSEPILVIVDLATGRAATHSLWQ
jgi:hypothetical protein